MPWYDLTINPKVIEGYYSGRPALDRIELQSARLYNDGPVLHLSANLGLFPDMPSKRWPKGANVAQIDLALWGIRALSVEGWATEMVGVFTLEHIAEHRLRFSFLSDTAAIRGECMAVRIDGISGYVRTAKPNPSICGPAESPDKSEAGTGLGATAFCVRQKGDQDMSGTLDYEQMIFLDAEDLAESGIREAYESLLPELQKYVAQPAEVEEVIDHQVGRYAVRSGTRDFVIYAPELHDEGGESWGRATVAFFTIVNDQLANSEYRFYAINGGNDLGGMFLTISQAAAAQQALPNKTDWPYLPKDEPGWYGQYH